MQIVRDWPRRNRLELLTPAEIAIRAAISAVEAAGADTLLTDAIVLLGQAKEKVADYAEKSGEVPELAEYDPQEDASWRQTLCVGWRKKEDAVTKGEYWLRWTSPRGLYYWLHPEGRWVGEPEQINMPTFPSYAAAEEAGRRADKPVLDERV
jgi:hypothetical protein